MSGDDNPSLTQAGAAQPTGAYRAAGGTTTMAALALVAAVTSSFWSPPLFKLLHLRTPAAATTARQDVDIGRLNQSVADLERKLAEVNANLVKAQQDSAAAKTAQAAAGRGSVWSPWSNCNRRCAVPARLTSSWRWSARPTASLVRWLRPWRRSTSRLQRASWLAPSFALSSTSWPTS